MQKTIDLFLCECDCANHQLVFKIYDYTDDETYWEEDPNEVVFASIEVFLSDNKNFFRRCWQGLKYIFGWGYDYRFGEWQSVDLDVEKADRLIAGLEKYKKIVADYEKSKNKKLPNLDAGIKSID